MYIILPAAATPGERRSLDLPEAFSERTNEGTMMILALN